MYSLFVPLFFVGIGLKADLGSLGEAPLLVLALLAVAVAGKVAGCYLGARLSRFTNEEALRVGVGMMSRGEIALVIAAAGLSAGAVDDTVFSASVLMALATTILTPIFLKLTYVRKPVGEPVPSLAVEEATAFRWTMWWPLAAGLQQPTIKHRPECFDFPVHTLPLALGRGLSPPALASGPATIDVPVA